MSLAQQGRRVVLAGLLLLGGVYVRALAFTPVERFQGPAQKIFYLHVPAAVTTELAVILVGLAGVFFLFLKDPRLDRFAEASAEVSTLFLFFLLISYHLLRGAVTDAGLRARYGAVLGICAVVLVGFIHLSVYLFPTLHPQPIVLRPGKPGLPPEMLVTLLLSFGVFLILYVGFVMQRYAIALRREAASHG
jgi:heme exporter protein C